MFRPMTFISAACAMVLAGCPHDDDDHGANGHETAFPACTEITQACHEVDVGDGPIHDCHDNAHAATQESTCTAIKANCLKICADAKVDGGGAGDAGGGG